jgi:hypothetical protein
MLGSSRVAAQLAASREGLGSMSGDDDECSFEETVKFCLNRQVTHLPSKMPSVFSSMYSTVNSIFHFSFFIFRSGLTVTGLSRVYSMYLFSYAIYTTHFTSNNPHFNGN